MGTLDHSTLKSLTTLPAQSTSKYLLRIQLCSIEHWVSNSQSSSPAGKDDVHYSSDEQDWFSRAYTETMEETERYR